MKVFSILIIFLFLSTSVFADQKEPFGVIIKLKGDVTVLGKAVKKGDHLNEGANISAKGKKSFIQIRFLDGPQVLLRNGELVLRRPKRGKGTLLKLIKGTLFSDVNKKNKEHFFVKTRSVTMGVRGTKFYTEAKGNNTYLCVCEGVVDFTNKKGTVSVKKKQDIEAGKTTELKVTSAPDMMWKMALEGFDIMGVKI